MTRQPKKSRIKWLRLLAAGCLLVVLQGCAQADIPNARNVDIPPPATADKRAKAVNEKPDNVLYLPLGSDVLVPDIGTTDPLPDVQVGPFELRSETLAGALQLILADYNVPLAFQSDDAMNKRITVTDLHGSLTEVVNSVCGLADLFCAYQNGIMTVKPTQIFTVKIPPLSQDTSFMNNVAQGLAAILSSDATAKAPVSDTSTHTIIYEATNRTAEMAERYFQRMRSNTALIVFETYIWEVSLNGDNNAGVNWSMLERLGKSKFSIPLSLPGGTGLTNAVSIGLPTAQTGTAAISEKDIVDFLSTFGSVKTISQPQVTVLSGSKATLTANETTNYVASVTQTVTNGQTTASSTTGSAKSGFDLSIGSAWDNATVYADISIDVNELLGIDKFSFNTDTNGGSTQVQLPHTTERKITTQVRIRPGDSLLIAGLVQEGDSYTSSGPGFTKPVFPTSREAKTSNLEVVFMMRPRVVVFTNPDEKAEFNFVRNAPPTADAQDLTFNYNFAPLKEAIGAPPGEPVKSGSQPQLPQDRKKAGLPVDLLNPGGGAMPKGQ